MAALSDPDVHRVPVLPPRRALWLVPLIGALGFVPAAAWMWPVRPLDAGASALLQLFELGNGGHVRIVALRELGAPDPHGAVHDSLLLLSVDGFAGELSLGLGMRQQGCAPLVVALAAALLTRAPPLRRLQTAAVACLLTLAYVGASLLVLGHWVLATRLPAVYPASGGVRTLLDVAVHAFVLPPVLRLVVPVGLALMATRVVHATLERRARR